MIPQPKNYCMVISLMKGYLQVLGDCSLLYVCENCDEIATYNEPNCGCNREHIRVIPTNDHLYQ
jgi:hypothetical protein